ncbi:MAG: serine/threonine-protein kinase PknK [Polyangiaceae bacterium]|nr:serine/threonine-protein kinase PknK [Polyangiaceae bacterium]
MDDGGVTGRFRPVRELGRGAMGVVELVHDRERGHAVALKRLTAPVVVGRFKAEFRLLAQLSHPNLVRVYELLQDADGLAFSMEAIDGEPVDAYVRAAGAPIASLLRQLADALAYIHAHGVVHRDLKPSNVLVRADGTLKVLDFGVADAASSHTWRSIAGTPGYMAPEQIAGEPAVAASDLYALGCLLFELSAGRPVFEGTRLGVLEAHRAQPPPRLREVAPGVDPLFDALCEELLAKDPRARPTAGELLARLTRSGAPSPPRRKPARKLILGRDTLVDDAITRIERADRPLLGLTGPSGVGKTAVMELVTQKLAMAGWVVLRGSARPEERVPFNAVDGAVDELARCLDRPGQRDEEVRRHAVAACGMFPVLSGIGCAVSEQLKEHVRARLFGSEPDVTRPSAFDALAWLMRRAAGGARGVVIALDDFQWADDDTLALLAHLRGAPWLRVLLAVRDDLRNTPAARWVASAGRECELSIPRLAPEVLAEIIASTSGFALAPGEARAAAAACDGRPFLAEVRGRALATGGPVELEHVVAACSSVEMELLAAVVVADGFSELPLLARLAGMPLVAVERAAAELERRGLVRRGARARIDGEVDVYHDGVRHLVTEVFSGPTTVAHSRWAALLAADPKAPAARVARHWIGAGREDLAAPFALEAAERAERQGAFGLAADMLAVALRHAGDASGGLRERRALALERVGRHREAADEWALLGRGATGDRRLDFALAGAHALIAAGEVDAGLLGLDAALRAAGEPATYSRSPRSLLEAASFALGPPGHRVRAALPRRGPTGRDAASRDLQIGVLLAFLDPISGVRHLLRARDAFAGAGAVDDEAQCEAMFAVLALIGSRHGRVPLADRYAARARALLGGRSVEEPRAMLDFVDGLVALRAGRWERSRRAFDAAEGGFLRRNRPSERLMSRSWRTMPDVYGQDVAAMREHVAWFRQHLNEQGGDLIVAHVELLDAYLHYVLGDFAGCRERAQRIVAKFDTRRPNVQHAGALLYRHMPDVYQPERVDALVEYRDAERLARRFRFYDTTYAGAFAMVGGLLEARALRLGDRRASLRRLRWYADRIATSPPLMAGADQRILAYAADARGDRCGAVAHLRGAQAAAERHLRPLDAAIAAHQLGLRLGGDEGRAHRERALAAVVSRGASPAILHEDAAMR